MRKLAKSLSTVANEIYNSQEAGTATHKTHALSAVVGAMAAYRAPLPSSEVMSPKEWYIVNCLGGVESFVGSINEHCVLDVKGALDVAKAIWESRYSIVHVPASKESVASLMEIVGSGNYRVPPVYADAIKATNCSKFQELMIIATQLSKDAVELETTEG